MRATKATGFIESIDVDIEPRRVKLSIIFTGEDALQMQYSIIGNASITIEPIEFDLGAEGRYVAVCKTTGELITYTVWHDNGLTQILRIQQDTLSWDMNSDMFYAFYEALGEL